MLLERWELAKGAGGQAVFVSGEAGIGKSRLVDALVERMQEDRHELIRLQCSPYHTTSAFYPVIQRLSRIAALLRRRPWGAGGKTRSPASVLWG